LLTEPQAADARLDMTDIATFIPDDTRRIFPKIGEFIYFFSQIELALRDILANSIDLPDGLLYPVTASYDFSKLCDVALAAFDRRCTHPATIARLKRLISQCKEVNIDRNRVVHGTWWPAIDPETGSIVGGAFYHMHRGSMRVGPHFDNDQALDSAIQKCASTFKEAFEFMCGMLLDGPADPGARPRRPVVRDDVFPHHGPQD
jgi:hypothetical protein